MKLSSRATRWVATAAVAAGLAAVVPSVALATSAHPTSPATVLACETPGLVIWLSNPSGTAGSTFYKLNFTNQSGHACTLNGFPFLFAINIKGHRVGQPHAKFTGGPPHSVTIGNNRTAAAVLQVVDADNFPKATCHPVWAAGFRVFPPNQQRAKDVPLPFRACSNATVKLLFVRPVK